MNQLHVFRKQSIKLMTIIYTTETWDTRWSVLLEKKEVSVFLSLVVVVPGSTAAALSLNQLSTEQFVSDLR